MLISALKSGYVQLLKLCSSVQQDHPSMQLRIHVPIVSNDSQSLNLHEACTFQFLNVHLLLFAI